MCSNILFLFLLHLLNFFQTFFFRNLTLFFLLFLFNCPSFMLGHMRVHSYLTSIKMKTSYDVAWFISFRFLQCSIFVSKSTFCNPLCIEETSPLCTTWSFTVKFVSYFHTCICIWRWCCWWWWWRWWWRRGQDQIFFIYNTKSSTIQIFPKSIFITNQIPILTYTCHPNKSFVP